MQRDIALAPLHLAKEGPVQAAGVGQLLLALTQLLAAVLPRSGSVRAASEMGSPAMERNYIRSERVGPETMRPITMRIMLAWPARRTEGRGAGRRCPTRSARQSFGPFRGGLMGR